MPRQTVLSEPNTSQPCVNDGKAKTFAAKRALSEAKRKRKPARKAA
jgi:hypothetical protein